MSDFIQKETNLNELPLDQLDHPDMLAGYRLWQGWCRQDSCPTWSTVSLMEMPPNLIPTCSVIDVIDRGRDFRYRYWGSFLADIFGRDETGVRASMHPIPLDRQLRVYQFNAVIQRKIPLLFVSALERDGRVAVKKTNLRLPIMDQPNTVTKILTLSEFEPVRPEDEQDLIGYWEGVNGWI